MSLHLASPDCDLDYLSRHFGPSAHNLQLMLEIRDRVNAAVQASDLLGVRDDILNVRFAPDDHELPRTEFLARFKECFSLREVERDLDYHGCRRIAFLHRYLGRLHLPRGMRYCSAWIHYELHRSGALFELLEAQDQNGLISCRSDLPARLESLFGLSVSYLEIPGMYRDLKPADATGDYIERLQSCLENVRVAFPGMVFLVGGGLFGKLYCHAIQSQGGIALDVGALLDAWVGIPSRPTVYRHLYGSQVSVQDVPTELQLTARTIDALLANRSKRVQ